MSRLQIVLDQIIQVRRYTQSLLDSIEETDWFRLPHEAVTHVAWQVGHIAIAEYSLTLRRIRSRSREDEVLIPAEFAKKFGKGSVPEADPAQYPKVAEILAVFHRVHEQALAELASLPEATLDEPTKPPHPLFDTKFGAIQFAPQHEMLHAGQIGLLRRLFGCEPLR